MLELAGKGFKQWLQISTRNATKNGHKSLNIWRNLEEKWKLYQNQRNYTWQHIISKIKIHQLS